MMNPWNTRYQAENYVYGKEPNVFLEEMQPKLQMKGRALAVAEGEGRNAVFLAEQGMDVTAWDYAESGLEKTGNLGKERGVKVHTELVDLNEVTWKKEQWDEMICIFGHFPKALQNFLNEKAHCFSCGMWSDNGLSHVIQFVGKKPMREPF